MSDKEERRKNIRNALIATGVVAAFGVGYYIYSSSSTKGQDRNDLNEDPTKIEQITYAGDTDDITSNKKDIEVTQYER